MKLASTTLFLAFWLFPFSAAAQAIPADGEVSAPIFLAQITRDGTTSTTVTPTETGVRIDDGNRAGGNLYHSFGEFSIPTGSEAFFNNASDIANIFSRVTGGNISNINGLIRANGAANLFLINPAGIVFGNDARLQLGGSFYGSTADSIVFPDGEFSAVDLENPPLITVNAPIGLGFRDHPGEIVNTSFGQNPNGETNITGGAVGLQVANGETLALVGGNILLDDGNLTAKGGHIEIGSVKSAGEVGITETDTSFALDYDEINFFGDITVAQNSLINSSGIGGGSINIQGGELNVSGNSQILSRTLGDIDGEDIRINTQRLIVQDGSLISTLTSGAGTGGNIKIEAEESVELLRTPENSTLPTAIFTNSVSFNSEDDNLNSGDAGNLEINTKNLIIQDGSQISSASGLLTGDGEVLPSGGAGGDIKIHADESVTISGSSENGIFPSSILSSTGINNDQPAGEITIDTSRFIFEGQALISASSISDGDGGDIEIKASEFMQISGSDETLSELIAVSLPETEVEDISFEIVRGALITVTNSGRGGNIKLTTPVLNLDKSSLISTISLGSGKGGNLEIETSQKVEVSDSLITTSSSNLGNAGDINIDTNQLIVNHGIITTGTLDLGDAGDINIDTNQLIVNHNGNISTFSSGLGKAGDMTINADKINLESGGSLNATTLSGKGGSINIGSEQSPVEQLNVTNGAEINVNSEGQGDAGDLFIHTSNLNLDSGSLFASTGIGQGGNIILNIADDLTLRNNSLISTEAVDEASGGNINIGAEFIIAYPSGDNSSGNDITASAQQGQGGAISITAESLLGLEERRAFDNNGTNDIDASSGTDGLDGTVTISTPENNPLRETTELTDNLVTAEVITTSDVCSASDIEDVSRLAVQGKGAIATEPTAPLDGDALIVNGEPETSNSNAPHNNSSYLDPNEIPPHVQPVAYKDNGEPIYLARGIIKQEDGTVILTTVPHHNIPPRTPENPYSCGQ